MFLDPEYVKLANEKTIHLLSYDLQKDLDGGAAEEIATVEREGQKVDVLAHYPMFTPDEIQALLTDVASHLKYPTKTPWTGVISPDGQKTLWENAEKKAPISKTFEDAYDAEQAKLGKTLPRTEWKRVTALLEASTKADADSKWKEAVTAVLAAKSGSSMYPAPFIDRIQRWADTLNDEGISAIDNAKKLKDPAARAKELAKLASDFEGLPAAALAKDAAK